jgi:hypothetical protein
MMTNRLWRMSVCVAAAVLIVGSAAWAKQVVVTLKDGRKITGDLVSESPDAVDRLHRQDQHHLPPHRHRQRGRQAHAGVDVQAET